MFTKAHCNYCLVVHTMKTFLQALSLPFRCHSCSDALKKKEKKVLKACQNEDPFILGGTTQRNGKYICSIRGIHLQLYLFVCVFI